MEYTEIQKLIDSMGESKLTDLEIEFADGTKISMKKSPAVESKAISTETTNNIINAATIPAAETTTQVVSNIIIPATIEAIKADSKIVKAPMVGTFYSKANPNAAPFVTEGDKVEKGQTLCIVEAMKLMNEIESDFAGNVKTVFVKDGEMVEYGQPLFEIE